MNENEKRDPEAQLTLLGPGPPTNKEGNVGGLDPRTRATQHLAAGPAPLPSFAGPVASLKETRTRQTAPVNEDQ